MASRFWVGSTATWDSTAGTKWATTTGGAGGASVPTAADDVFLDANSGANTVTLSSTSVCRSMDCTGFTGTLSLPASTTFNIGDASGGAFKLVAGMTFTIGNAITSVLAFVSTSNNGGTGWSITTGGKVMTQANFTGTGGKWVLQDGWTTGNLAGMALTAGTLDTNGQSVTTGTMTTSGSTTRVLTLGASSITLGATNGWLISSATGLTLNANTSTITSSAAGATFSGGSLTYNNVSMTGSGTANVTGNNTFATFTRTGTAVVSDALSFSGTPTINTALVLSGNSVTNRLLVTSGTVGTSRSVTLGASATCRTAGTLNVDFMDITMSGGAANERDLSAITGLSGDCGGNGGITFTTGSTQTATGTASFTWSTHGWTSRVPLPQDDVVVNNAFVAGRTVTADMPRLGRSIDFTGVTGGVALNPTAASPAIFGSFTLAAGVASFTGNQPTMMGRSSYTITSAGVAWGVGATGLIVTAPGGTYTLQDALTISASTSNITLNNGTFATGGFAVTAAGINMQNNNTKTLNLGASTVTLTDVRNVSVFSAFTTGSTFTLGSSTIVISGASALARTITTSSAAVTFGTVTYTVANSPGALVLAGTNTFDTLNVGSGRLLTLPSATTTTVTTANIAGTMNGYVYLPGTTSNYASSPNAAPLQILGDIDVRVKVAMPSWSPTSGGSDVALVTKRSGATTGSSYVFQLGAASGSGKLRFLWHDGTSERNALATTTTGIADGTAYWVRATLDVDNGATGRDIKFYKSPDGSTWTQIGTTVTQASVTQIQSSTTELEVGALDGGATAGFAMSMYRAQVRSNILDNGTGIVFDADFSTKAVLASTFTESSTNAATVTINGSQALLGDGRVQLNSSTGASAATLSVATGGVMIPYASVQDITGTGGALFRAYGTSVSGNTGIAFGSNRTISAAGGNINATTAFVEAATPGTSDIVLATPLSGALTVNAATTIREMDLTGYVSTLTIANVSTTLTIGDASGGLMKLASGMTLTNGGTTSVITFASTVTNGGSGFGITTAGKSLPLVTFSGVGGKWVLQDAFTNTGLVSLAAGTLDTNSQSVTLSGTGNSGSITGAGAGVKVLTLGSSSVSSGGNWNMGSTSNLTVNASSSTLTLNVANTTFTGGGFTWGTVALTGSGTQQVTDANTFGTLRRTGTAAKTDGLTIAAALTVNTALVLAGNSSTNRIIVQSSVVGTARAITLGASATCRTAGTQHVDLQDITMSGGATNERDLSAITGLSGDCQGNTGITFTTSATQTSTGTASFTWSTHGWTSRVPLPQDDVVINNSFIAGRTISPDMPRLGRSIDLTGATGTPAFTQTVSNTVYGSLTFISGMTYTARAMNYAGRGNYTITTAGITMDGPGNGSSINAPGGTYTLQDAFTTPTAGGGFNLFFGTLTTTFNVTMANFSMSDGTTLNMGSGTWSLTNPGSVTILTISGATSVVNGSSATVAITSPSSLLRTIASGGKTLGTLTYTVANSPGQLKIVGTGNTFTTLNIGSGRQFTGTSNNTSTVTNWNVDGALNGGVYLLAGGNNCNPTVPDSPALSITSDIDLIVDCALADWSLNDQAFQAKDNNGATLSWRFITFTGGFLRLQLSTDGSTIVTTTSSASPGFAANTRHQVRSTWRASDGRVQFFTRPDSASAWTQLGTNVTLSIPSIADTAASVYVGCRSTNSSPASGMFYGVQVWSGFSDAGGTKQLDIDFTPGLTGRTWLDAAASQFTESSTNAATVTLNGASVAGDGRVVLDSTVAGSATTITGRLESKYASVKDFTATNQFIANDSINVSNNGANVKFLPPDAFPRKHYPTTRVQSLVRASTR